MLTVPVVALPADCRATTRPPAAARAVTGRTFFGLAALLSLVATVARNSWVFTRAVYEHGDAALNSLMVQNSHHEVLLTGPVSRVGFPHPGPFYVYVLSAGQALFHDWLPLARSAYGAQFLGAAVLQAVLVGFVVRTLYRLTASRPATVVGLAVVFWFAASHDMLGETWLPNLYMTAFALLVVSAIAVAAGRTGELPLLLAAGAMLIHGHVAFIFFVGVTWLLTGLGWLLAHRTDRRAALRAARRSLWWSVGVVLVFAAPLVAEVVLHFPGPWPDYLAYDGAGTGHSDADSLAFFGHFWSASYPATVTVLAGSAAAAALLLEEDRRRLRLFACGYAMLALQSALFLFYVMQGIDELVPINFYTGWFYETVPMFLLVLPAMHLTLLGLERVPARRSLRWAGGLAALALVVAGTVAPSLTAKDPHSTATGPLLAALTKHPDRAGRPIVLRFEHDEWSLMASTLAQARRQGVPACIADPYWRGLFTATSMCPSTAGHWAVADVARDHYHGGHKVIWSDSLHVVFEGNLPNLPPDRH